MKYAEYAEGSQMRRMIDRAYGFADDLRVALGRRPRKRYARGTATKCPLEAHLAFEHVSVGSTAIVISGPPAKRPELAKRLTAAGFEVQRIPGAFGASPRYEVKVPKDVKDFVQHADGTGEHLPTDIQGSWPT